MAVVTVEAHVGKISFVYQYEPPVLTRPTYEQDAREALDKLDEAVRQIRAGIIAGMHSNDKTVESGPINVKLAERRSEA